MTESVIKKYLDDVAKNLICSKKERKVFIKSLSEDINDFVADRDEVSASDLSAEFGKPEEVAASFAAHMDSTVLVKKVSIKRAVILGIIAGIILLIIGMLIGIRCYQRWEFFSHPDGYCVEWPIYVLETEEEVSEYNELFDQ